MKGEHSVLLATHKTDVHQQRKRLHRTVPAARIGAAILIAAVYLLAQASFSSAPQTIILVSLDGFRAEYLHRNVTPNLASIISRGIHSDYMTPSFPTLTWPNHYSIVTGLYPESHGIVGNLFHDSKLNADFDYMDFPGQKDSHWWGGEPIWVTAEKQGLRTASCMWPGSTASIRGEQPTYLQPLNFYKNASQRVDIALDWLSLPENDRPRFVAVYIGEVDHAGHMYGPEDVTGHVNEELAKVDESVGRLLDGLKGLDGEKGWFRYIRSWFGFTTTREWWEVANLVIVSDHGMGEGNTISKFVFLDDFVDASRFDIVDDVVVHVFPSEGQDVESLLNAWKKASEASGNWRVWKKEDVPASLHYSDNDRIGPIVVLPEPGWAVSKRVQNKSPQIATSKPFEVKGMHGYNNSLVDMRAIFMAAGPAFKPLPAAIPTFQNVELYSMMARILKLRSAAVTNGTLGFFDDYLQM
ncbi:alkaline-phosphatase-like protein [Chytriomyces cf. hyalinus JEL632]|nr:alkaline-phosphatase-like protein [Chytriomyces cf. hyalinus JEL632]